MQKLNLGCGQNKLPGFVNVDKYATCSPDVVWDLETFPWPFEDNAVDEIVLNHCLEHMGAAPDIFFGIIKEIYRVSAPNARIAINVPHPRSDAFIGDPTHVRIVTPMVMSLFSKKNCLEWQKKGEPNTPLALYLDVDFEIVATQHHLTPHWQQQLDSGKMTREEVNLAFTSYYNVSDEIRMTLKAIK